MKIIFCGPPHSGKSVLVANLEMFLPADSFKTIRVTKDGEGIWSNGVDQDEVKKIRVKESFDSKFIKEKCDEIKRAEQQIVLVDIGGKCLPDKEPIFRCCDSFLILSRDTSKFAEWREMGCANNTRCIGEFFSDLNGQDSCSIKNDILFGTISNLHRGNNLRDSNCLKSLAAYIIKISNYKPVPINETNIIDFNKVALKMNRAQIEQVNGIDFIRNVHFETVDAAGIYKATQNLISNKKEMKLYGARAVWVCSVAVKALKDAGVKRISIYDTGYAAYIPVKTAAFSNKKTQLNKGIEIQTLQSDSSVFIHLFNLKDVLNKDDYDHLTLPFLPENKKLFISGKMPLWILISVLNSYKNTEKFIYTPGSKTKFVCVSSIDSSKPGNTDELLEDIDYQTFLLDFGASKTNKIKTVYFDMDRVLVDFASQADKYKILKRNDRVNWLKVFFLGSKFWSQMEWFPGAEAAVDKILSVCKEKNVKTGILSSVRLLSGRRGKMKWCKNHVCFDTNDIHLIHRAEDKARFAENALLLDDNEENVNAFIQAGGKAIQIKEWNETVIDNIISQI